MEIESSCVHVDRHSQHRAWEDGSFNVFDQLTSSGLHLAGVAVQPVVTFALVQQLLELSAHFVAGNSYHNFH
jgi:hypothetical protein